MSPAAKKRSSVSPRATTASASAPVVALPLTSSRLTQAVAELSDRDTRLAAAIAAVGPCTLLPRTEGTHFGHLTRNIVYQQLSGSAAATIHGRFLKHVSAHVGVETEHPTPESVLAIDDDALRSCGLSVAKVRAIKDLAGHVSDGRLPLDRLDAMHDQEIIDALVPVRGIGPWTAQMFLMFRLGRPDVLPVLDLGVRKGAQQIYRTRALPDAARLEKIAKTWRPWASVASWYCWRVLDLEDAGGW
jgi:DNA-3-methyladenine glycosylase II